MLRAETVMDQMGKKLVVSRRRGRTVKDRSVSTFSWGWAGGSCCVGLLLTFCFGFGVGCLGGY